MKHTRVVSTKCTPGFACRAFIDTTLVCFIVNEQTTKCSRYTDRRTDRRTENTIHRAAWSQLKTIGHLFYATSSFVQHLVAIGEFKLELESGNAQSGSNSTLFRAVWPWNLTDDLQKQYGTFPKHYQAICIISSSYVNSNWSYSPETLKLGRALWPWPFAWTSLLSLVITPENFMMIRWWEHGEKGVTDRQTDRQTDRRTDRRTEPVI